jgi:hypothetical protein
MRARMVSLGMRRLPITRICAMVSGVCARAEIVPEARTSRRAIRTTRIALPTRLERELCAIFTGFEPCDEHKKSAVPEIDFTERICTPSLLKNLVEHYGKNDFITPRRGAPIVTPSQKLPLAHNPSANESHRVPESISQFTGPRSVAIVGQRLHQRAPGSMPVRREAMHQVSRFVSAEHDSARVNWATRPKP